MISIDFPQLSHNCVQHRIALTLFALSRPGTPTVILHLGTAQLALGEEGYVGSISPTLSKNTAETSWNYLKLPTLERTWLKLPCFEMFPLPHFFLWDILGVNVFTASLHPIHCGPWLHDEGIILQPSLCWIQDFFQEDKAISTFLKNLLSRWHFGIHNSLHLLGRFVWKGIT